ncbi:hypothetical protein ED733_004785 [Metarhizium rileyi]|uniref:Uncharacterized protein n=1 Tax=Metarhizium rileyi (strain RCEF 4871) TaxID=1649241 RepID=A0A5C6G975_METRR|nr:hypothetical protein ED733_004785 [Metarhizium rileyi]
MVPRYATQLHAPRQPPAYGAEGAPPLYKEETDPDDAKAKRKIKRTLCIRLLTSIFITVLVALIVAAVVARIHDSKINFNRSSGETASNRTKEISFTMITSNEPSSAQVAVTTTEAALEDVKTANVTRPAKTTSTASNSSAPATTTNAKVGQMVDCNSMGVFFNVTPVTHISPRPTKSVSTNRRRKVHLLVDDGDGDSDQMLSLSVYKHDRCLLSQASYRGSDGALTYRCSLTCPDKRWETNQARDVVAEEWGACG